MRADEVRQTRGDVHQAGRVALRQQRHRGIAGQERRTQVPLHRRVEDLGGRLGKRAHADHEAGKVDEAVEPAPLRIERLERLTQRSLIAGIDRQRQHGRRRRMASE